MKSKVGNIEISSEDRFLIALSKIVEKKHQDLLRITNSMLVIMFWEIGKTVNQYLDRNKKGKYNKYEFRDISRKLGINYGEYFSNKNLKKMQQFAKEFPERSVVLLLASIVSWEHILLLLRLKNFETKLFYIRLIAEKGLSKNQLHKQIADYLLKQPAEFKNSKYKDSVSGLTLYTPKISHLLKKILANATKYNVGIKNVFKGAYVFSFLKLINKLKIEVQIEKGKKINEVDKKLIESVSQIVKKYRFEQNNWLNANLNLFFLQIGKFINNEILLRKEDSDQKVIIRNASKQLQKMYVKKFFDEKQLYKMTEFSKQFCELGIALRIAYLMTWEHILLILPLHNLEAKLYYARLTATQKLSVANLRKQITYNVFEQTSSAKEHEKKLMDKLRAPKKVISIKKLPNEIVSIATINIAYSDDINNCTYDINVFKNRYFVNFIADV